MKIILIVAAGGAVGAVARYLVTAAVGGLAATSFPLPTLVVNVLGSFLLGVLVEAGALALTIGHEMRAFLAVGILGAFTTFSTFSMETVLLYERGALGQAALYVVASVLLSVGAFFAALRLVRLILA